MPDASLLDRAVAILGSLEARPTAMTAYVNRNGIGIHWRDATIWCHFARDQTIVTAFLCTFTDRQRTCYGAADRRGPTAELLRLLN